MLGPGQLPRVGLDTERRAGRCLRHPVRLGREQDLSVAADGSDDSAGDGLPQLWRRSAPVRRRIPQRCRGALEVVRSTGDSQDLLVYPIVYSLHHSVELRKRAP